MSEITIRVYAFLVNIQNEVLLLNEKYGEHRFTKLPGGGLEPNEGILECINRELKEELGLRDLNLLQFHVTEKYVQSKFRKNTQVIAVYYWCKNIGKSQVKIAEKNGNVLALKWVSLSDLKSTDFTFDTDKEAFRKFVKEKPNQ